MDALIDALINATNGEKIIVHDGGDFSSFTTLEGIFEYCFEDLLMHCRDEDVESLKAEYKNPTEEKKKQLVYEYGYELSKPTPKLVQEWEEYHNRPFTFFH